MPHYQEPKQQHVQLYLSFPLKSNEEQNVTYLLLTEAEVHSAGYGLTFSPSKYGTSTKCMDHNLKGDKIRIHNLQYRPRRWEQYIIYWSLLCFWRVLIKIKSSLISRDVVTAGIDGGGIRATGPEDGAKGTITRGVQGHAPPENFEI